LIHRVQRNDLIGKKILNVNEKYYISDHGIRNALFENNERDINLVLENIIYIELLRRGYNVKIGKLNDLEIDFIVSKSEKEKIYIQVSYLLASPETVEREFSVLEKIQDNYAKYVLSLDNFDMSRNGIIHKNIIEFLLEE
ncbi:ATPase, partial [Candidatus Gracilibacteria bacterium]